MTILEEAIVKLKIMINPIIFSYFINKSLDRSDIS